MRIVYITTGLNTGGAEIMLYNLLSRINRKCFDPAVISLMDLGTWGERIESLDMPIYVLGMKPGMLPTPRVIWRLIHAVNYLKPDLIQGWMYHGNLAASFASTFSSAKAPVFWSIHHSIAGLASEKRTTRAIIKLGIGISKYTRKVVFASQKSKVQHETLGYFSKNNYVIPNGFDTSLFKPSMEARSEFRGELGLSENTFLIGLICRFHPMKDHSNFLQAAALLSKEYPDVHFILAGRGVDKNNAFLEQLVKELKLSNIHMLGERKDIPFITAALDIASSSSAYGEAFPMIVGEAMSCGVPCVVTDIGDSRWAIADTGKVVPPASSEALADAWKELIVIGEEGRKALGEAARARIIEHFSLDSVVAQFENLYKGELIKK